MTLIVSNPPHLKSKVTTPFLMKQVIIALLPAVVASIHFFGMRAALLIANCILNAVVTERIILLLRKKPSAISDLNALHDLSLLTGLHNQTWQIRCLSLGQPPQIV